MKKGQRLTKIPGYVWCSAEGAIHHDTEDPYQTGTPCRGPHRSVFAYATPPEEPNPQTGRKPKPCNRITE